MVEAGFWGLVGGVALIVGAVLGLAFRVPTRVVGVVTAFGAGVLISAVAFDPVEESYERAGAGPALAGLVAGALAFYVGDLVVDRQGGNHRKRSGGQQAGGVAMAIVLGTVLDGVPESAAVGVSILDGGSVGTAVVAAVFLSNVPEAMSGAVGLRTAGLSVRWILTLWTVVALVSAASAALGYALLGGGPGDVSATTVAVVQTFAGGAVLAMLADTMMPEAFESTGPLTGIVTCAGFVTAFAIGHM